MRLDAKIMMDTEKIEKIILEFISNNLGRRYSLKEEDNIFYNKKKIGDVLFMEDILKREVAVELRIARKIMGKGQNLADAIEMSENECKFHLDKLSPLADLIRKEFGDRDYKITVDVVEIDWI